MTGCAGDTALPEVKSEKINGVAEDDADVDDVWKYYTDLQRVIAEFNSSNDKYRIKTVDYLVDGD